MIYRCILPDWAVAKFPNRPKVVEGDFDEAYIEKLNSEFYNIYFVPNPPSTYKPGTSLNGTHIDVFSYVFVDMDLKDGKWTKESFLGCIKSSPHLLPTMVIDSGNGIHVYWEVSDLDAISYLRLQRRLTRLFDTDEAVSKIMQIMRAPGTVNTKKEDDLKLCIMLDHNNVIYTCEQLDRLIPPISVKDEEYCKNHYNKTYSVGQNLNSVNDKLPTKFGELLNSNKEVKDLFLAHLEDRSKADYRLGHIMFASGFTKEEATSVLINTAKASTRAPTHRINYATNIVDKIWTFELEPVKISTLSESVTDILSKSQNAPKDIRFPCWSYIDATHHGFRLGQVIGLVAGSGVGKTTMALNMFRGFVQNNPDYIHFFIPLEQPASEIAERWKLMCGENTQLHDKVHVISNYDEKGSFRHLSFSEIKDYLLNFQTATGKKVGCVVIDHIGALKKQGKNGENQDLMTICHEMKAFAIQTNTLLIMQSQSSREKAGIGDLELDKDAAYGTVYFESYCDYLITIWQPLKRCYSNPACPTIMAFKFCKIRHKKQGRDNIAEDTAYKLLFNPVDESLQTLTQEQDKSFDYFKTQATNLRKRDRKTDVGEYKSISWEGKNGKPSNNQDSG